MSQTMRHHVPNQKPNQASEKLRESEGTVVRDRRTARGMCGGLSLAP